MQILGAKKSEMSCSEIALISGEFFSSDNVDSERIRANWLWINTDQCWLFSCSRNQRWTALKNVKSLKQHCFAPSSFLCQDIGGISGVSWQVYTDPDVSCIFLPVFGGKIRVLAAWLLAFSENMRRYRKNVRAGCVRIAQAFYYKKWEPVK